MEIIPSHSQKLLNRAEVSEILGYKGKTGHSIRNLEKRGLLTRIEFSQRNIRYREEDVKRLIENCKVGGES